MTDLSIPELAQRHEANWSKGYRVFPEIINKLGLQTGVEVGVAFGGHARAILELTEVSELTGVDAYTHRDGYDDPMNLPQPAFDELHQFTTERLKPYSDRFTLLRQDSVQAARSFEQPLDFVYLDADHSEDGLRRDLAAWYAKIRIGGIIAGHDYGHRDFPGVQRAVDHFLGRFGLTAQRAPGGIWYAVVPEAAISFFIPCFNCEPWIDDTVQSVLTTNARKQDELILVNDGSSDGTAKKLKDWAKEDARVRVIHHPTNKGGAAARNTAVRAAKHPLLFCLDADNQLPTSAVSPLLDHLLGSADDAVSFAELRFFKDGTEPTKTTHTVEYPNRAATLEDFLSTNHVAGGGGNFLFTRDAWRRAGGYPNDAGALDAWGFALRLAAAGCRIGVAADSYYHHRYSHDSYWTRDNRDGRLGPAAVQLLQPVMHRLVPEDQRYIISPRGTDEWFANRRQRPLRLSTLPNKPRRSFAHWSFRRRIVATLGHVPTVADLRKLRLILGVGRSGTSWTFGVLSASQGIPIRAYREPLTYLEPSIPLSSDGEHTAAPFADALPNHHPLVTGYRVLCADESGRIANKGLMREDPGARAVLAKEVHALLATPALLAITKAPAVLLVRDPIRIADSVFHAQGLDTRYLIGEAHHARKPEFLAAVLDPQRHEDTARVQAELADISDHRLRRIGDLVITSALIHRLFQRCQRLFPNVALVSYEDLCADPANTFPRLAATLGLPWDDAAHAKLLKTSNPAENPDPNDPYTIYRQTQNQADKPLKFLTEKDTAAALRFLDRAGLNSSVTETSQPNNTPLQKAG
ncbi:MAG: glycosyltransferase [Planctomycetota bacterium]